MQEEIKQKLEDPKENDKTIAEAPKSKVRLSKKKIFFFCLFLILAFTILLVISLLTYTITSRFRDFKSEQIQLQNQVETYTSKGFDLSVVQENISNIKKNEANSFLTYLLQPNYFSNLSSEIALKNNVQKNQILSELENAKVKLKNFSIANVISESDTLTSMDNAVKSEIESENLLNASKILEDYVNKVNLRIQILDKIDNLNKDTISQTNNYANAQIDWNDEAAKTKWQTIVNLVNNETYDNLDNSISEYRQIVSNKLAEIDKNMQTDIDNFARKYNSLYTICSVYGCKLNEKIEITGESIFDKYKLAKTKFEENKKALDDYVLSRSSKITNKRILVNLSSLKAYVIEDYEIVNIFYTSTGDRQHPTRIGEFDIFDKIPNAASGYWKIWMPYWMSIYYAGASINGIHGISTTADGKKVSQWDYAVGRYSTTYGCVMFRDKDAKWLYNWAEIGTSVSVVY